ncbi:MAG: helix-turn-helix domain-containing protein [Clostridia bacterium]|nr:helix-turn-helix domain-containing protein [Clostridia bacterium]
MRDKDVVKYARLLDIYESVLTERQAMAMEEYYGRDFTMEETAENLGISKQAVHFAVKNAEQKIDKLEAQLQIQSRLSLVSVKLEGIRCMVEDDAPKEEILDMIDTMLAGLQ